MKPHTVSFVLTLLLATGPALSQEQMEPPYRLTHPADRISCLSPGLETSPITICVIETNKGLIVVDTGLSPSMAVRTRARISSEIGRDDIHWVINTHSHFDHTGGNQVFSDATIIGHENVPAAMQAFYDGREAWIERRYQFLARHEAGSSDAPPDSQQAKSLEERLFFNHELIEDLRDGYLPTTPAITFSDRLTLKAGDLELVLIWMGRAHTDSDILIHIPTLGVLFTGDLFHDKTLGTAYYTSPLDIDRWLSALDSVLEDGDIDVVIGGHGLIFTPEWIAAQRRYLGEVWQAVREAKASGTSFAKLTEGLPFDDRFAYIQDELGVPAEELAARHAEILQDFWRIGRVTQ